MPERDFEQYRPYLDVLARTQLDPRLQAKIDLSGVIQQTLLEAHKDAAQIHGQDSKCCLAWLRRVLANNLADEIRKLTAARRGTAREVSLDEAMQASSVRLQAVLAAEQTSPSMKVEKEEEILHLTEAIARLPEAQREVLVLHHFQNWKLQQIAEHLGRSREAVAGLLKRALKFLREQFQD